MMGILIKLAQIIMNILGNIITQCNVLGLFMFGTSGLAQALMRRLVKGIERLDQARDTSSHYALQFVRTGGNLCPC